MPKFTPGQRVRVVPDTADPVAYPYRARHGYVQQVYQSVGTAETGGISPVVHYDVLLDGDLVRSGEVVRLAEHTLQAGTR